MFINEYFPQNFCNCFNQSKKGNFFFTFSILFLFDKINFYVLGNIVSKYIIDVRIWEEMKKILNVLKFDIYSIRIRLISINFLFDFLIQVYLTEVDIFWLIQFSIHNKKKGFLNSKKISEFFSIVPLRVNFSFKKFDILQIFFNVNQPFHFKNLVYRRFANHIFIQLSVSRKFSYYIKINIKQFLYSKLHFSVLICSLNNININFIYFLNYKIFFSNIKIENPYKQNSFKIFNVSKETLNILNKINFKYSLYRIYFELNFYIAYNLFRTKFNMLFLRDKRIWCYVFQLESKRCFQFSKLIGSFDFIDIKEIYKNKLFSFQKNIFNTYLFCLQRISRKLINTILIINLTNSVQSLDIFLKQYSFIFFSNVLFIKSYHSYYYFHLNTQNLSFKNRFPFSFSVLLLYFPLNLIFRKLNLMGFFHTRKNKVIGNVKFIFFEDFSLIEIYSSLMFVYYYWYYYCKNKLALKKLIYLLRKSCFLTLSRKHNKHKFWSYKIFTFSILTKKKCFFLNRTFVKNDFYIFYCKQNIYLINKLVLYIIF